MPEECANVRSDEVLWKLRRALELADLVVWEYEAGSGRLLGAEGVAKLLGYALLPSSNEVWDFEQWWSKVEPVDRDCLEEEIQRTEAGEQPALNWRFRMVHADGGHRWMQLKAQRVQTSEGTSQLLGALQDITSQKEAELAWMESERSARQLMESTSAIPFELCLRRDAMTYVGPQIEVWLGHPVGRWYEMAFWKSPIHPQDRSAVVTRWLHAKPEDRDLQLGFRMMGERGEEYRVHSIVSLSRRADGSRVLRGFLLDVTGQHRIEAKVVRVQETMQRLVNSAPVAIVAVDHEGLVTAWNPAAEQLFGWSEAEVLGRLCPAVPEDRRFELGALMRRVQAGQCVQGIETVRIHKEGRRLFVSLSIAPVLDERDALRSAIISCEDVTGRLLAKEALQQSATQLRMIAERANIGICILDPNGAFEFTNPHYNAIFGAAPGELVGQHFAIVAPESCREEYQAIFERIIAGKLLNGEPQDYDLQTLKGEHVRAEVAWVRFFGADFRPRVLVYLSDVTEHRRFVHELQAAKDAAERTAQAKGEFVAQISHEIRTPMSCVIGLSELLLARSLEPDCREMVQTILNSGEALTRIVNDLLDYSKLEAGRMELALAPFLLSETVEELRRTLNPLALKKGIGLRTSLDKGIPRVVLGDAGRLRQVLINLMGNAIKFTERGMVSLTVENTERGIRFEVRDTGMGMTEETRSQLFQWYRQGAHGAQHRYGGTGLGLAISQQLVELMGGRIEVDSRLGIGSTFAFEVVMQASELPPPGDEHSHERQPHKTRVLIIDDYAPIRKVTELQLRSMGCEVAGVDCGTAAITWLENHGCDLVLLDWNLGAQQGWEVARDLRQRWGNRLRIVGFSAEPIPQAQRDAVLDDMLLKPYRRADLAKLLRRHPAPAACSVCANVSLSPPLLDEESCEIHGALSRLVKEVGSKQVNDVVQLFLHQAHEELDRMRDSARKGELKRDLVANLAHRLKGSAALYGLEGLAHKAEELSLAAAGLDAARLNGALESMRTDLIRLETAFAKLHRPA